ncbi:uracil-DNA glycosylase family protein [Neptuniibacter sp. QD29_5]|uniref:uracil-DNA glycosylase family protein n=1 Tax=Neptuniibacter sp. QD29_5 TaxID=3398207 RepID=UPI0039F61826
MFKKDVKYFIANWGIKLIQLLDQVRDCRLCEKALPLGPRPVVQASADSKLLIIGQAPGSKVHQSGIPWDDPSGDRLREWLRLDKETFYDANKIAIMPMGFCYPGKGQSGDNPPRPECAPTWHERLLNEMPSIQLTLLIGQYAQRYYLKQLEALADYKTLTERVKNADKAPTHLLPLPHPSPRNQIWLKKNPWFEAETLPLLRKRLTMIDL